MSNSILFKLQRHSDHHTWAMRPYHLLRNFKESPQLPSGYPGMLVLALFPPIYRFVMNPLVDAAKVTPENYDEKGNFRKGERWEAAERQANRRFSAFSLAFMAAFYKLAF